MIKVRAGERKERATALSMSDWVQKSTTWVKRKEKRIILNGEERVLSSPMGLAAGFFMLVWIQDGPATPDYLGVT